MKKTFFLIFIIGCLSQLIQCNNKQSLNKQMHISNEVESALDTSALEAVSTIYGKWSKGFPFYSCDLTIEEDGTFRYDALGCTGNSYTEGTWISYEQDLFLTSFEKYKEQPLNIAVKSKTTIIGNYEDKTSRFLEDTFFLSSEELEFLRTSDIYFDREVFRLKGDTLYALDKNSLRVKSKFFR